MKFEILGRPKGKGRARHGNGHTYTPEDTRAYMDYVAYCFRQAGGKKTIYPVVVKMVVFMPIPKNFSKQMRIQALAGFVLPQVKPDNDNVEKIVFDALNGVAWNDDTQVVENRTVKYFSDDPRIVVEITEADTEYYKCNGRYKRRVRKDEDET